MESRENMVMFLLAEYRVKDINKRLEYKNKLYSLSLEKLVKLFNKQLKTFR